MLAVLADGDSREIDAGKQLIAPNLASDLVAETLFHLVRLLRRIDTVTKDTKRVPVVEADFFTYPLKEVCGPEGPLLVVGNPPWVTNADLGRWAAANRPALHARKQRTSPS